MYIKTTYETVKSEFPDTLNVLENKLRNGTSKRKNDPLEDFDFEFQVAERIQGASSFGQMLDDIGKPEEEETVDEIVERRVENSSVIVVMKQGRCVYRKKVDSVPSVVEEKYRESEEERKKEQERVDNLSEEERQKEINDAISELQKMGGFGIFGIKQD